MEQYVLDNVDRFQMLVQRFKPPTISRSKAPTSEGTGVNSGMIVAARLRCLLKEEVDAGFPPAVFPRISVPGLIDIHELKRPVRGLATLQSSDFRVDRVFGPDATTEEVYDDVVKPLVPWTWDGGVGTLFAYGQTGSGKTYTVSRLEKLVADELMSGKLQGKRTIKLAIIELSGSNTHDLLNDRQSISVLEDAFGVIQLSGVLEHRVSTVKEMLTLIDTATALRRTEATDKNNASSRSHAICRIRIQKQLDTPDDDADGMLYLVDLAGSEAARDTSQHNAQRMRETRDINSSLSVLKDCIRGKAEADAAAAGSGSGGATSKRKPHIPFRQSPLTKILKHVFDPAALRNCSTVVIACVNPCVLDAVPSRNTLRYAETLRVITPKVVEIKYDAIVPRTWNNKELRSWIQTNSSFPAIDASLLAPTETGIQLLRLDPDEFHARCLETPGVSIRQAIAFRSRIWEMHIDSQRTLQRPQKSTTNNASKPRKTPDSGLKVAEKMPTDERTDENSSRDFLDRIHPGMAIKWTPSDELVVVAPGADMAIILCPAAAAGPNARDIRGRPIEIDTEAKKGQKDHPSTRYLCALLKTSATPDAYELEIWRQVVIEVSQMKGEVLLRYDSSTRYYHTSA